MENEAGAGEQRELFTYERWFVNTLRRCLRRLDSSQNNKDDLQTFTQAQRWSGLCTCLSDNVKKCIAKTFSSALSSGFVQKFLRNSLWTKIMFFYIKHSSFVKECNLCRWSWKNIYQNRIPFLRIASKRNLEWNENTLARWTLSGVKSFCWIDRYARVQYVGVIAWFWKGIPTLKREGVIS